MVRKLRNTLSALSAAGLVMAAALALQEPIVLDAPHLAALSQAQADADADAPQTQPTQRRRARAAFATPYFSFAQALRGITRS